MPFDTPFDDKWGNGPSGGPWSPDQIANVLVWNNPDDPVSVPTAELAPATDFVDLISGAGTWAEPSATAPILRSTGGVKYLDFSGSKQMSLVGADLNIQQSHIVGLMKIPSSNAGRVFLGHSTINNQFGFYNNIFRAVGAPAIWNNELSYTGVGFTWAIYEAQFLPAGTSYIAIDGITVDTSVATQLTAVDINRLGNYSGTSGYFNGFLGEYLAAISPMASSDRDNMLARLAAKRDLLNGV